MVTSCLGFCVFWVGLSALTCSAFLSAGEQLPHSAQALRDSLPLLSSTSVPLGSPFLTTSSPVARRPSEKEVVWARGTSWAASATTYLAAAGCKPVSGLCRPGSPTLQSADPEWISLCAHGEPTDRCASSISIAGRSSEQRAE